jgi:hypothetical protein
MTLLRLLGVVTVLLLCTTLAHAGQSRVKGLASRGQGKVVDAFPSLSSSSPLDCQWNINGSDCWTAEIASFYKLRNGTAGLSAMPITAYQQVLDYSCGPCSVMNIFHYFGALSDADMNFQTEQAYSEAMHANPQTGTDSDNIVQFVRKQGWTVDTGVNGTIGMIKQNVAAGVPMILEWVDWGGHYVVASGYSTASPDYQNDVDMLFLADSASASNEVPSLQGWTAFNPDRFFSMWFGFADNGAIITGNWVSMVPPGFVPKNAQKVANQ